MKIMKNNVKRLIETEMGYHEPLFNGHESNTWLKEFKSVNDAFEEIGGISFSAIQSLVDSTGIHEVDRWTGKGIPITWESLIFSAIEALKEEENDEYGNRCTHEVHGHTKLIAWSGGLVLENCGSIITATIYFYRTGSITRNCAANDWQPVL